jgi:PII-like signaling protein
VISEPEIEQAVEIIPVVIAPIQSKQKIPQMLENLDEVMQTYNRENP